MAVTLKTTVKIDGMEIAFDGPFSEVLAAIKELRAINKPTRAPRVFNESVSEESTASDSVSAELTRQPRGENRERVLTIIKDHFPLSNGRQAHIQRKFKEVFGVEIAVSSLRHALNQLEKSGKVIRRGDDWLLRPTPKGWGQASHV